MYLLCMYFPFPMIFSIELHNAVCPGGASVSLMVLLEEVAVSRMEAKTRMDNLT